MRKFAILAVLLFVPLFSHAAEYRWIQFILNNGQPFWAIQIVQRVKADETTIEDVVRDYIWKFDGLHGVSAKTIERVARCESGLNPYAKGDYRNGEPMAYGVMQFWRKTFEAFREESDVNDLEYKNWMHQIDLAYWAFGNGKKSHWVCE